MNFIETKIREAEELMERNKNIPSWDELSEEERLNRMTGRSGSLPTSRDGPCQHKML